MSLFLVKHGNVLKNQLSTKFSVLRPDQNISRKQECIPVGCVPSAAVAVSWGGRCLPRQGVSAQGGCMPLWTDRHL